jgi:ATP-dependent helicase/nuclease subunit A
VRANLIRFLELALELDSGRYPSLVHFLATLATLRGTEDAPDETTAQPGEAGVRILTIHAAKGLEAPVVFLADTAAAPADDSGYQTLVDWSPGATRPGALMLAPSSKRRDSGTARLISEKQSREAREDANLLYVALTRARQMLVITGAAMSRSSKGSWYELLAESMSAVTGVEHTPDGALAFEYGERPRLVRPVSPSSEPVIEPAPGLQRRWGLRATPAPLAPSGPEDGLLADTTTDADGRLRGTGIHLLLEWLTADRPMPGDDLLARAAVRLGLDPGARELADWLAEARAVIEDPALAFLFDAGRYERAYNEVPVSYHLGGRQVNGVIDRIVIASDTAHVVDYKTHPVEDPGELSGLAMGYIDQLSLYSEAATRLWPGYRIEARLLFTRARKLVDPRPSAGTAI